MPPIYYYICFLLNLAAVTKNGGASFETKTSTTQNPVVCDYERSKDISTGEHLGYYQVAFAIVAY